MPRLVPSLSDLLASSPELWDVASQAPGAAGSLPLTDEILRDWPSGDLFGLSQNAGMGWPPNELLGPEFLIVSTQGGVRGEEGQPIALGYHTGHWEVGLLVQAAAREFKRLGGVPYAGFCSDPCDGRSQGTPAMFDSLAYRNDAALVLRRLIRSLPRRRGVLGVATCDKGLPATMLALASMRDLPGILVPGGVTLPPQSGEDAGKIQTIGARYVHGELSLEEAAQLGCAACATPGGGCQFLGTAATSQVVAEALGLALPHAALAPSGQPVWLDTATRSARALVSLDAKGIASRDILTEDAVHNAMVVHAACGGSTNLLLHLTAIAHAAGLARPGVEDWHAVNRQVPRFVDVLPNGPVNHVTVQLFLAGGVPEIMLKLRNLDLLRLDCLTVTGQTIGENLSWWEHSPRRQQVRQLLVDQDGVSPDEVILDPAEANRRGMTSTVCFPRGNLAPEGSVIKSTAIDPTMLDAQGVYRQTGPAKIFTSEREVIRAVKGQGSQTISPGDVIILCGRGPLGTGMEETAQITIALKHLDWGKHVALLTDGRFSGVSTGACIGHIGPEALAGGPIGRLQSGDIIDVRVDTRGLTGTIDLVGHGSQRFGPERGAAILASRSLRDDLRPDARLPDDTRLWAALQRVGGGTWGGCVYDTQRILATLDAATRLPQPAPPN